jgi:pimeloyl-ACP methyl ester carboxylesterase
MRNKSKPALSQKILLLFLALVVSIMACKQQKEPPAIANIISIRAYTDFCFYGQKLTRVEITYNANADLSSVTPDTYILSDRGYANPDFAEAAIESIRVDGQLVTLNITRDTEALEDNALVYNGDNASGSRSKNPIGTYATGPWYRAVDGFIHFGEEDSELYKANTSRDGYQTRKCLELKLYHAGERAEEAACLANEDGSYKTDGLWLPTIDANYGEDGFRTFEDLGIQVPTTATDGERFVRGWAYFPPDFNIDRPEKYPLIITITGYGTSFWRHEDGTNNFGTGLNFDGSAFRWMDCGAIVLNIHDRSHTGGENYKFWIDDYHAIQYFIGNYNADPENITLSGNSRGTMACNTIASTYPGLVNTLILNNGSMGNGIAGARMFEGTWTEVEWQEAARSGLSIWAFDGEMDTDNKEIYRDAISYYKEAGWSDEWIAENIRLTGFPTELYYYWGETDHSTTKMTYWYFFDEPYSGPDAEIVDGQLVYHNKLKEGDSYQLKGRLEQGSFNKEGFDYIIYGNTLKDWVLSRDYETR